MWNLNFLIALLLIFLCSKVNKPKRSSWKFKNTELRAFMEPLCNKVIWKKSTKTTKESFWTWTILVLTLSVHSYMIPVKEQRIPYFLKRSSHESSASVSTDFYPHESLGKGESLCKHHEKQRKIFILLHRSSSIAIQDVAIDERNS